MNIASALFRNSTGEDLIVKTHTLLLVTGSILASAASVEARAQDVPQVPAQEADSQYLNVIVVTAQKRDENVQDVPIAINAYSGEALISSGVENTIDLQVKEPSLVFSTNASFGQPYLRGVGSDLFTPGAESSIATFVDDVYQSRTTSALQDFFDVQRVDVVKGPQGVLFGRNAVGGAINIYSNKPTNAFEGYFNATYGNFDKVRLEGALNVPVVDDRVAWRVAGLFSQRDGYTDNLFNGGEVDDEDFVALRSHLDFNVTDNFDLLISGTYTSEDSSRSLAARVEPSLGLAIADAFGASRPAGAFNVALNEDSLIDIETFSISAEANWDFGAVALKSISAYRETDTEVLLDLDGSELDFASNNVFQDSETFSQEFQLISQNDGPFEWVLGLFYLHEEASQQLNVALTFPAVTNAPSDFLDQPGGTVETDSFGVFANAKYRLTDQLAFSAGIRYNRDERDLDFLESLSVISTGAPIPGPPPLQLSDSYDAFTPRFVLEYKPSGDVLLYASASRGYKAGGFNTNTFQPAGFEPETLWAYEAGIKSTFWDGRARVNSAGFYYDYSNLQLNTIPPGSPVGTFQIVINAAEATIKGWEADASFVPVDDFEVNAGFQLLDAEFDEFLALNPNDVASGEVDRAGGRLPRAPEFSLNIGAQYTWYIGDRPLVLRGDYRYESSQFLDIFQDATVSRDSNSVFNTRLTYEVSDNLSLAAWGRNLTNEDIVQSSLRVDGLFGTIQFFAPPRTYGGTVKVKF